MRLGRLLAAAVLALASSTAAAQDDGLLLRDGDRVVFYGDSITQQRLYTRYVQQYVYCRYPELDISFFNAGWGGDTAEGANKRVLRDVLELRPTVVTLFFGMNDGGYRAPDPAIRKGFGEELARLVDSLTANGARVVVITPGCVDPSRAKRMDGTVYNKALRGLADEALKIAKDRGVTALDMHEALLTFQTAQQAANPEFTMIPDSVHPNAGGHVVMAQALLGALGAEPMPPLGEVDIARKSATGLSLIEADDREVVLEAAAPQPASVWIDPAATTVATACGFVRDMAGRRLVVKGLARGTWDIAVDGTRLGEVTAKDFAEGRSIGSVGWERGRRLHELVKRREDHYFQLWRDVRLKYEGRQGLRELVASMMETNAQYHAMIRALAQPKGAHRITLSRVPSSINLALKRPYVTSDANGFGYGLGGLTDGDWTADGKHCFATGNSREIAKTVTVDLGRSERIGAVRLGIPPFGSTRTIVVSLSAKGKRWKEVARHAFGAASGQRKTLWFDPKPGRHVRLTFEDRYQQRHGHEPAFAFVTELEVYGGK